MQKPVLLICSCINVFAPSKLTDPNLRKSQYLNSLIYFITKSKINRIIIIENTNTNWVTDEILELANKHEKIVEILLFTGNVDFANKHSIGYSHFEMVNECFKQSKILELNDSLMVMDGRHIIKNINLIYDNLINGSCAFIPEIHRFKRNNLCDIRFYLITRDNFLKYIWTRRFELSNNRDGWAETILDKILKSQNFDFHSLYVLPRIIGIQGSTGTNWDGNNFLYYYFKRFYMRVLNLYKYNP